MSTALSLEDLNSSYGLGEQVKFTGSADFPMVELRNDLAQAKISVYGGQVLSFQPSGAAETLFLSETAYYQAGKAIKGGAPVCWPWFGSDPEGKGRPQHGFVRNRLWTVSKTEALASGETQVVLALSDNEETREIWPQKFELAIAFTLGKSLKIELITRNTGDSAFSITQALHTYFAISDITKTQVIGLDGKAYLDKVDGMSEKTQSGAIAFSGEVDRIYLDVPATLAIEDGGGDRKIKIESAGSKTAVVWNPWAEISKNSGDLTDDAYQSFVCVETTNAATDVIEVAAESEYRLTAIYSLES